MNMEEWWNVTERGKLKYWNKNLFQRHIFHYISHRDWITKQPLNQLPRIICRKENLFTLISPSLFYLLVHGRCRGFLWFHLITLKHTSPSVGLLWTRDRPVAQTSTWQHKHCTSQTPIPPLGFEPTVLSSARLHTYALDRAATGIGRKWELSWKIVLPAFSLWSVQSPVKYDFINVTNCRPFYCYSLCQNCR
jgi:hypothetical protein